VSPTKIKSEGARIIKRSLAKEDGSETGIVGYWFSFVVACVECLFIPFGVVLGAFTIIVLSRRSVKELYGIETIANSVSPSV